MTSISSALLAIGQRNHYRERPDKLNRDVALGSKHDIFNLKKSAALPGSDMCSTARPAEEDETEIVEIKLCPDTAPYHKPAVLL